MPAKKKPLPLHVSRALIAREQANVVVRTQRRIAILRANEILKDNNADDNDKPVSVSVPVHSHNHFCLTFFCFCVLLLLMNLLFLQWVYYQVRKAKDL
jgi:hypothetical protein